MDMEITISMKAAKMVEVLEPILAHARMAAESGATFSDTFYGKSEDGSDVIVNFDNDDMERDEIKADQVFVEVEEQ